MEAGLKIEGWIRLAQRLGRKLQESVRDAQSVASIDMGIDGRSETIEL